MRAIILIVSLASLTACSTVQRLTNRDGMSQQDRAAYLAEEERAEQARQDIKPGMSLADFKARWAEPDRIEYVSGYYILRYNNNEEPIDFYFKDDKLAQWQFDDNTASNLRAQHSNNRAIAAQEEQNRQQRMMNVISALQSNSANRPRNCVTRGVGNTAYTNCN